MTKGTGDHSWVLDALPEFLAGRLGEEESERVEAHLEECADCRVKANAVSLLQQTPVPSPDPDRWDTFVDGVVTETGRHRLPGRRWLGPGLAAVAVIAVAVAGILMMEPGGEEAPEVAAALEALAADVAELSPEEAAAWTVGVAPPAAVPQLEGSGLTPEELEQVVQEAGRS